MAMSSKTIATLQRVHKNQPEHLQFFGVIGNALSFSRMSISQNRFPLLGDMLYFLQIALTQMAKVAMNRLTEMKDRTSWTRSVMLETPLCSRMFIFVLFLFQSQHPFWPAIHFRVYE